MYLDLVGTTPTVSELNDFLADSAKDKRENFIDKLLGSFGYARRMSWFLDVTLMERDKDSKVPRAPGKSTCGARAPRTSLTTCSCERCSRTTAPTRRRGPRRSSSSTAKWNRTSSRRTSAASSSAATCSARSATTTPSSTTTSRPTTTAFKPFSTARSCSRTPTRPTAVIAEKAEGDVSFHERVRQEQEAELRSARRCPGGKAVHGSGKRRSGKEYKVAPARDVKSPCRRTVAARCCADAVTSTENKAFSRNAVNRVWAMMVGREIVHPVDMDHRINPPSHPELGLDELAAEFVKHMYDIKWLVREIAAFPSAYLRSS